ncbi:S41 family peptidase [Patescibacteria group bacterium]|nr:S41 family peptidase [Patescibacteria group bacterium]MBU4162190.1 S41 family peptidase [Patescibacteria group bacterium]
MKKTFILKILFGIILIIIGVFVFSFGYRYGYNQIPRPPVGLPADADFTLLWDVWYKLGEKYSGELDYQKMIYGAAQGLVRGLGDPYTVFFNPEDSQIFKDDIAGSFEGVGMEIGIRKGELTVVTPLEGTPAQKAGLLPGDIIMKIDDSFSRDIATDEAVKLIRGPKGTAVKLTIFREGWSDTKVFEISRDVIKIPNFQWEIINGDIAKIKVYQFSSGLDSDFSKIVPKILDSSAKKIILDLRSNPGGLLYEAQLMAGWFLNKGDMVTIESFGEGRDEKEYRAIGSGALFEYPTVILINQGTASGAEILAAALRDNRDDVKLIGEKSFGKGSVQEPVDLRGGALLKVTVAHWLTPNREMINEIGLTPDIEIKITEDDYKENRDPQLDKALEELK